MKLTPIDGDPFALTPVDGNPFMALTDYARTLPATQPPIGQPGGAPLDDFAPAPVSAVAPQPTFPGLAGIAGDPSRSLGVRLPAAIGSSLADQGRGLVQSAWGAATLPGDVARGLVDPNSPEAIRRSTDLAGLLTLPSVGAEANPDVLGAMSGARGSSKGQQLALIPVDQDPFAALSSDMNLRTSYWGGETGRRYTHTPIEYREMPYSPGVAVPWKFGIDPDGTPWITGNSFPQDRNVTRALQDYFNPLPDGVFIRTAWRPDDYNYLLSGKHIGSLNHAKGSSEQGLSVAKHPELPQKYAYYVKGKQIGTGSDGEPILETSTAKPFGKLMKYSELAEQFELMKRHKLNEMGISPEQAKILQTTTRVVPSDNYKKFAGSPDAEIVGSSGKYKMPPKWSHPFRSEDKP